MEHPAPTGDEGEATTAPATAVEAPASPDAAAKPVGGAAATTPAKPARKSATGRSTKNDTEASPEPIRDAAAPDAAEAAPVKRATRIKKTKEVTS